VYLSREPLDELNYLQNLNLKKLDNILHEIVKKNLTESK